MDEPQKPTAVTDQPVSDFRRYQDGCRSSVGRRIRTVIARSEDFAIYRCDDSHSLNWETSNMLPGASQIHLEAKMVEAEIGAAMRGTHRERVDSVFSACLVAALQSGATENIARFFQPIRNYIEKHSPTTIYGQGSNFSVFQGKKANVAFEFRNGTPLMTAAVAEMQKIRGQGATLPKALKDQLSELLGRGLASAFEAKGPDEMQTCFAASREYLERTAQGVSKARFALYAVGTAISGSLALTALLLEVAQEFPQHVVYVASAIGGLIGALISLLQRTDQVPIPIFFPRRYLLVQACIRLTLGGCFGFIAAVASKSNLALGMFAGSPLTLFLLGIVAGFSERLVPDMLGSLETRKQQ